VTRKRTWMPAEDQIIRETMDLPAATVAARLPGRTPRSVSQRRAVVAGIIKPKLTKPATTARGRSHWLIAKTCPGCGQFLPVAAYSRRSRGGWDQWCTACMRRTTRAHTDREAAQTRETAHRHYQLWTGSELDTVLAQDAGGRWLHTTADAAALVGRTSAAVQHARNTYRNAAT